MRLARVITCALAVWPTWLVAELPDVVQDCMAGILASEPFDMVGLVPLDPAEIGRETADARAQFFRAGDGELVRANMQVYGLRTCTVFREGGGAVMTEDEVTDYARTAGMRMDPSCSNAKRQIWQAPEMNSSGRSATVALRLSEAGEVVEFIAFEGLRPPEERGCAGQEAQ